MWNHRFLKVGLQDMMMTEGEVDAGIAQVWIVEGVEGIESFRIVFGGAVPAQEFSAEINTHFRDNSSTICMMG